MTIALIGPSGAGKGTQAARLVATGNLLHISTGDLFRDALEKRSALGFLTRQYMNCGELVPDEVVGSLIEEWMVKAMPGREILFDGFPRTRFQAQLLDDLSNRQGRELRAVIYLKVPDEEVVRRLQGRIVCRSCQTPYHLEFLPPAVAGRCDLCRGELYTRDDDNPDTVLTRIRNSHRTLEPLLDHYAEMGKLVIVDGVGDVAAISATLNQVMADIEAGSAAFANAEALGDIQPLKGTVTAISSTEARRAALDIVLLGGPGSGKGTQAKILTRELALDHVATGDLFRENIRGETELGKLAKTYIDRGELVPDDVTEAMVEDRLSRIEDNRGFILDGFPRTTPQAEALTEIMNTLERRLSAVLHIRVSDDAIVKRLSDRLTCRKCQTPYHREFNPPETEGVCDKCGGELYVRDDDNPETVRARLKTYHAQTAPLINYYRGLGLLVEIDGEQSMETVTGRMLEVLGDLGRKSRPPAV